jgi:sulfate/thiosulfate transport system substrate-binding protein
MPLRSIHIAVPCLVLLVALASPGCNEAGSTTARQAQKSTAEQPAAEGAEGKAEATGPVTLLHVSYDPTRELWKAVNAAFTAQYLQDKGIEVTITPSHGGAASQTRNVIEGVEADVVSLPLPTDTQAIARAGLINEGWEEKFPNHSLPYTSTIVFVVRKGNPKQVKDWPDLVQDKIEVVTPSPKTSGNGKLSFLAAWGSVLKHGGSEQDAKDYVAKLYRNNVVALDTSSRAGTVTFSKKEIGDVHLAWESEAFMEIQEAGGELELVVPSVSILAEPRVAIVDKNVDRHGTRKVAEDYLTFFYTDAAQRIIAENYYRPINPDVLAEFPDRFAPVELFTVTEVAKGWEDAEKRFFADDGVFDGIYNGSTR